MPIQTLPYWIQRADFTSHEHDAVDVARAVELVRLHNWQAELRFKEELEASGQDACPPGIGFVAGAGRILHVCPLADGLAVVHYHFMERGRLLGIIPKKVNVSRTNPAVASSRIPEFVRHFYAADHSWLLERTTQA
jgi:hypothetical protein